MNKNIIITGRDGCGKSILASMLSEGKRTHMWTGHFSKVPPHTRVIIVDNISTNKFFSDVHKLIDFCRMQSIQLICVLQAGVEVQGDKWQVFRLH